MFESAHLNSKNITAMQLAHFYATALNLNHSYLSFKSLDQEICEAVCLAKFP